MSIGFLFWLLMILWVIFGVAPSFPRGTTGGWAPFGSSFLLFVLILLLGIEVFGWPIHR